MNRIVWYAGLYSASAALLKLAGFVLFLWIARTLPLSDYASFGLLYAVQTGITTFAIAGIVEAVVGLSRGRRSASERRALYAAASRAFVVMSLLAGGIAAAVFNVVAHRTASSFVALLWVLVSGALLALASLQAQMVRLEERHLESLAFSFGAPLISLIGGAAAFAVGRNAGTFFCGSAIGAAVALSALWRSREGSFATEVSVPAGTIMTSGAPFVAIAVLSWLGGYGNTYIINGIFPAVEVARFTFTLSLSSIMLLVATAANQVWNPWFYRITHEAPIDAVERKNRAFFRTQALMLGVVAGTLVAVFPAAMRTLGGNLVSYQSMRVELALLLGSYIVQGPAWHCQNYYLAHGLGPELMRINLTMSAVGVAVAVALMLTLGPMGVYVGFMAQTALRTLGIVLRARRHWAVTVSWEGVATGLAIMLVGLGLSGT